MADQDKRWTTEEISNYISGFPGEQKDSVIRELVGAKLIRQFLDTPEGKLLLDSTVDSIRDNTMKIVSLSVSGFDKSIDEIRQAALQINVAYDFMYGVATQLNRGEDHEKRMKYV
jgi:hypothetical protein